MAAGSWRGRERNFLGGSDEFSPVVPLALALSGAVAPRLFADGFAGKQYVVAMTPSRAVSLSKPAAWLSGRTSAVGGFVRKGRFPGEAGGPVCLAVELPEGWMYVDAAGHATGSHAGSFDVPAWERFARANAGAGWVGSPMMKIDIENGLRVPVVLYDIAGFRRGSVRTGTRGRILTWFGGHRVQVGSRTRVSFSGGSGAAEVTPETGMAISFGRVGTGVVRIGFKAL